MMDRSSISKILVVSLSNIGDCIITLPVLAVLRAEFERARIDLICGKVPLSLFKGSEDLGKVFVYDKKWSWIQKWFWVRELAKEKYDLVIDLRHTAIPLLVGAKYRTQMIRLKKSSHISVRQKHLSLLSDLGLNIKNQKLISLFGCSEADQVQDKLSQQGFVPGDAYAVVAPGANSGTKRWTADGFKNIVRHLTEERQLKVVIAGGPEEDWSGMHEKNVFDLTGKTSLKELAALIQGSKLVVANDSAIMQLAQELGVSVVTIFGPTNPWKYTKESDRVKVVRLDLECSPCEQARCQIERRKCLDDLSANQVKEAIEKVINTPRPLRGHPLKRGIKKSPLKEGWRRRRRGV